MIFLTFTRLKFDGFLSIKADRQVASLRTIGPVYYLGLCIYLRNLIITIIMIYC